MSKKFRKPHPSPPRWMWLNDLDDNCWDCKDKTGCSSCTKIKRGLKLRDIPSGHDQREMQKGNSDD